MNPLEQFELTSSKITVMNSFLHTGKVWVRKSRPGLPDTENRWYISNGPVWDWVNSEYKAFTENDL